ncbi:MAG: cytochrome c [Rhodocyclales bacterium]|nr:cytochrome c [Rhodocyclales bacterium]
MKKTLLGALGLVALSAVAAAGIIQAGALDFAADEPHSEFVYGLTTWAREQSIARAVIDSDLVLPQDLSAPERVRRGAGNYDAMCSQCHLSPDVEDSEIRKGLYPVPPNLTGKTVASNPARRFWVIKHGIKGSGMPAWSKGGMEDGAIWDMVAFLKILPGLSSEAYRAQVEVSDGHSHTGAGSHDESGQPLGVATQRSDHLHDHSHKGHIHEH